MRPGLIAGALGPSTVSLNTNKSSSSSRLSQALSLSRIYMSVDAPSPCSASWGWRRSRRRSWRLRRSGRRTMRKRLHQHPREQVVSQGGRWRGTAIIARGWGARPFIFFSPVQTGLPRELTMSLNRATQPGPVSPGGGEQAQRHKPASLSSESGESLGHVGCYPTIVGGEEG